MEWGYWTQTTVFQIGASNYFFDNKGYYVLGDHTENRPTSGSYSYSGDAWGTYFTTDHGVDMTGTFCATVDFAASSNHVTDFDLAVQNSAGTYKAEIANGKGSFGSSHFSLDTAQGTWTLTPTIGGPQSKRCVGSLYGPNGQYMGGAWGIYEDSTHGASGIFQGSRSSGSSGGS